MNSNKTRLIGPLLLSLSVTACGGGSAGTTVAGPSEPVVNTALLTPTPVGEKTISFIHLNDLHAHLTAHADLVKDPGTGATTIAKRGGLARTATLIKQIRQENPNSVLMNIGDTYHGGVEALYTNGNAIVDPVKALGVDVGVPGNWDFAYGPTVTRLRYADLNAIEQAALTSVAGMTIKRPGFQNLAANITYSAPRLKAGKPFLPPTYQKNIGGVEVGFIGISSDIVPRMSDALAIGLNFTQGQDAHRLLIEQYSAKLRATGAQVIVVMSELGLHRDTQLANLVATGSVDVFFSAHTHEAVLVPIQSKSGALVVEAGNDGFLGRMDVTVNQGKVSARKWTLLNIDETIPEDAKIVALIEKERAPFLTSSVNMQVPMPMTDQRLTQPINTVVGKTQGVLHRRNALENPFNNAFTDALRKYAGTQVAMTPGFRFDSVTGYEDSALTSGDVTIEDLYRLFPVPYTLATAEISGASLQAIVEQQLTTVFSKDAFKHSGGWLEGYSGIDFQVNIAGNDGARVVSAKLALQDVASVPNLTIAGCQRPMESTGTLCSYTGFSNIKPLVNIQTGTAWNPVDFSSYAISMGLLTGVPRNSIKDVSNTPLWPASTYMQPLW